MAKTRRGRKPMSERRGREAVDGREAVGGPEAPHAPGAPGMAAAAEPARSATGAETFPGESAVERLFVPLALLILVVAAAIRLPELAQNPFHHDEGVNGFFTTNLVRNGIFRYDPANYHGPTLFYFALVSEVLFGLTSEAMRLVPVVFGVLVVGVVLALRPVLGSVPALVAGGLLAISPGMVYVSRYFIHEMLLVAFSAAFVAGLLLYARDRRPASMLLAAGSAALIFATKETGIITVAVLAIAALVSGWWVGFRSGGRRPAPTAARTRARTPAASAWDVPRETVIGALIVFGCIYVLFFSSFFTNFPQGLVDSIQSFMIWTQTGGETQVQPFQQYLVWMARAEAPILVLGTVGGLIAAIRGTDRLWVFIGLWALGVTLAYSIVSYKTPWIAINMVLPLALLAGYAIREALASRRTRLLAPVALVAAVALSGYQAIDLAYRHYDDETYGYVFVHTTREALDLVAEIEAVAERTGTGAETGVTITSPDYWPLPWYLRDYPRVGFWGEIVDTEEPIVVANVSQGADVAARLGDRYTSRGTYLLRPGVELELFVRADLAGT